MLLPSIDVGSPSRKTTPLVKTEITILSSASVPVRLKVPVSASKVTPIKSNSSVTRTSDEAPITPAAVASIDTSRSPEKRPSSIAVAVKVAEFSPSAKVKPAGTVRAESSLESIATVSEPLTSPLRVRVAVAVPPSSEIEDAMSNARTVARSVTETASVWESVRPAASVTVTSTS